MKIVIGNQFRLTNFHSKIHKEVFLSKLKNKKDHIDLNDTTVVIWNYKKELDNEKLFNAYISINNIYIFIDLETAEYLSFRDGNPYNHVMFTNIVSWIRMKYNKQFNRLLENMKMFRENLINKELDYTYYQGIFSDTFAVRTGGRELLVREWNSNDKRKKSLLEVDENFSFFLKVCKLVI